MSQGSENELAKVVIDWLQSEGYEVYEEISPWGGNGRRADLVARKGAIVWVIETKKSFNLEALEQAHGWTPYAHYSSIAVWQNNRLTAITEEVCRKFGVGFITVRDWGDSTERYTVCERTEGFFNRRANTTAIRRMFCEETKAVGNAGKSAQFFDTPFKMTCRKLLRLVKETPGVELEEAVRRIAHHYKDNRKAKINLLNRIQMGEVPEINVHQHGKKFLLFPADYTGDLIQALATKIQPETTANTSLRRVTQIDLFT